MPKRNKEIRSSATYSGLFVIYTVTVFVALTVIMPGEDVWYFGLLKASVWPL